MFCRNCGKQILEGSAFCAECGHKVESAPTTTSPTTAAPVNDAAAPKAEEKPKKKKTVVTGKISYEFIQGLVSKLDGDMVQVIPITNHYFGEKITVTGLITGGDLMEQLKGKDLGKKIVLSSSMLRHGDTVFLDDITVEDVERELNVKAVVVPNDGYALLAALLDR